MKKMSARDAVVILKRGGVIVFPTDTVWGVGAYIESDKGIENFYKIKKRDGQKPTAVLVGSIDQAEKYGKFNKNSKKLTSKHWPGALTVVVPATEKVNKKILNSSGGVGIRLPQSELIQRLCDDLDAGIVASSANFSNQPPPKIIEEVSGDLIDLVDGVINIEPEAGKENRDTKSSTVVDCMGDKLVVLRQGDIWV